MRGDERGWRSRRHREHVEGDYHNPPPVEKYAKERAYSKQIMKREPVVLTQAAQDVACARMVEALHHHTIEVAVLCVDDHHFHVLARVPDHNPRRWIGIAKKESARALSRANLVSPGGVWAVRFRCLPITNKAHFENAQKYIADHASRGASVWMRPDTNAASPGIAIPGR